jgi:Protein of unknown function (DUF3631)
MSNKFTLNAVQISRQSWVVILQNDDQHFIHQINLLNAKARQDYINRAKFKFMNIPRKDLTVELNNLAAELISAKIEANIQGKNIDFSAPQAWPDSVDGAEVLNQISQTLSRHLVLPAGAADAIALWMAHTHCFQAFSYTPRLHITSPEKQCGKTTLLRIIDSLVAKPFRIRNVTDSAVFRVIEQCNPTVLVDEAESFIFDNDKLCDVLVAGYEQDSRIIRGVGYEKVPRVFDVFSPAVISGIGGIPVPLLDRSIPIRLFRVKPGELSQRFDSRKTEHEENLRRKLARFAADNFQRIKDSDPALPPGAYNRLADNWRPLFAIAEIAGGDWPDRARTAFAALVDQRENEQDLGVMLLADIRQIFTEQGIDRIPSAGLVQALNAMTDRPWSEAHKGGSVSKVWLARKLEAFDIYPCTIRVEEKTPKGYILTAFGDAFERYLPQQEKSIRNAVTTPENIDASSTSQSATNSHNVADQKAQNTLQNKPLLHCCVSDTQNESLKEKSEKPQPPRPQPPRPQPPRPQPPKPQPQRTQVPSPQQQKLQLQRQQLQMQHQQRLELQRQQLQRLQPQKPVMPWPELQKMQKLNRNPFMAKGLPPGTALPRREDSG